MLTNKNTFFKLFSVFFLLVATTSVKGQEYECRINPTSCSTFVYQVRCIDASSVSSSGDFIYAMDIHFACLNTFSLSFTGNYNGFSIGNPATATENGYNVVTFAEIGYGQLTTDLSLNTWVDVASFTIGVGATNFFLTTTSETPTYKNDIGTDSYFATNQLGVAAPTGTLAKVWNGGTTGQETAWSTGANWCPASAPAAGEAIIIPSSLSYYPVLSGDISLNSLELQSGASLDLNGHQLTLTNGLNTTGTIKGSTTSSLIINGTAAVALTMDQTTPGVSNALRNLTVNNSGGLSLNNALRVSGILTLTSGTLTSGGNLTLAALNKYQYGQVSPSGAGTIAGNLSIEKVINDTTTGWRNFALPLNGSLSGLSGIEMLYSNHATATERNIFSWDASENTGGNANGWTSASASDDENKAYLLFSERGAASIHHIDTLISFTGAYSHADFDADLYATVDPASSGASATGWNNIPNPWPSNIDIDEIFASNFLNGITYKAIHVYDAVSNQYIAKCSSGVSLTNYNTAGGTVSTSILQPFQSFWVKSDLSGFSAHTKTLPNSVRTTDTTGMGKFFKKNYDLLRLNVLDKDSAWDQTVVYFATGASANLDEAFDAYKLISYSTDVPSIYTVTADGKLAINALDESKINHSVALGFKTNKTGNVTFSVDLSELNPNTHVYLEDKVMGGFHNIKEAPYTFAASTMESNDRFVLHFMPYALSLDQLIQPKAQLSVAGNGVDVFAFVPENSSTQTYKLEVMDMMGRVVFVSDKVELKAGTNKLDLHVPASANYAIRLSNSGATVNAKVFIK